MAISELLQMPIDLGGKWKATLIRLIPEHGMPRWQCESSPSTCSAVALSQCVVQLSLSDSCQQKHPLGSFYHQIFLHFCANKYKLPWLQLPCPILPFLALHKRCELSYAAVPFILPAARSLLSRRSYPLVLILAPECRNEQKGKTSNEPLRLYPVDSLFCLLLGGAWKDFPLAGCRYRRVCGAWEVAEVQALLALQRFFPGLKFCRVLWLGNDGMARAGYLGLMLWCRSVRRNMVPHEGGDQQQVLLRKNLSLRLQLNSL